MIDQECRHTKIAYAFWFAWRENLLPRFGHIVLSCKQGARHEHFTGSATEIDGDFRIREFDQTIMIAVGMAQKNTVDLWADTEQTWYVFNNATLNQALSIRFAPS